jgi:iron(III) transport system permease protein
MDDVDGYVVCVVLVVLSLASLLAARKYLSLAEYASLQRAAPVTGTLQGPKLAIVWLVIALILAISLLPHIGIVLLSFSKIWSFTLLPTTYTLGNYEEILFRVPHFVINTLVYTLLAAAVDIVLGATIAFLLLRTRVPGKTCSTPSPRCRWRSPASSSRSATCACFTAGTSPDLARH